MFFCLAVLVFQVSHLGLLYFWRWFLCEVTDMGLSSLFSYGIQFFLNRLVTMVHFLRCMCLLSLSNSKWLTLCELMFWSSVLFWWSACLLFLLQWPDKTSQQLLLTPALLFLPRIVLAIQVFLWFHMNFWIILFLFLWRLRGGFWLELLQSVNGFW